MTQKSLITNTSGAEFSECRTYRYVLWRRWDPGKPMVAFIGLNPSTADETTDDPTIRRCIGFAKRWGYGGVYMLNLFAFRATDPREMKSAADPVGPQNDGYLIEYGRSSSMVVAAWGVHGAHERRGEKMLMSLPRHIEKPLRCLGLTKGGHPRHPLYIKADQEAIPYYQATERTCR